MGSWFVDLIKYTLFGFGYVYLRLKGKSDHVKVTAKTDIIAFDCRHAGVHL